jgi:hypothetical protein
MKGLDEAKEAYGRADHYILKEAPSLAGMQGLKRPELVHER